MRGVSSGDCFVGSKACGGQIKIRYPPDPSARPALRCSMTTRSGTIMAQGFVKRPGKL